MSPNSDTATQNTPLAPSVEKAYYRKCIALKRRLNEVEAANDEARVRRVRLDRAITKMRLERAFLLDALRRRMDHPYDVHSDPNSADEGLATPPTDRPHRDKRRRLAGAAAASASASAAPVPLSGQTGSMTAAKEEAGDGSVVDGVAGQTQSTTADGDKMDVLGEGEAAATAATTNGVAGGKGGGEGDAAVENGA